MRYLILPLIAAALLLGGCISAEQLAREAQVAQERVAQVAEQVASLETLIAALPEGEAKAKALQALATAQSTLTSAEIAADSIAKAATRAAAGGGIFDIGIGVLSIFIPAAGAVYYQWKQARRNFTALRQTVVAVDKAAKVLPSDSLSVLYEKFDVTQDPETQSQVNKIQGKK